MGYRDKDGNWHDRCLDKVDPHEPIFVLRAQDKSAPALIRAWASLAKERGCDSQKIDEAEATAIAMEDWPTRKWPD